MSEQPRVIELEAEEPKRSLLWLKRKGAFPEALRGYADKLIEGVQQRNLYLAQLCIEQMTEILGLTSETENWTTQRYFEEEIAPQLWRMIKEVQPYLEEEGIIEDLIKLTSLKFTSSDYKPHKTRR